MTIYTMEDTIKTQEACMKKYPDINEVPLFMCAYCPAKPDCGKTACG